MVPQLEPEAGLAAWTLQIISRALPVQNPFKITQHTAEHGP